MEKEVAIKVEDLYKAFKIPHEKHTSLKAAVLNIFKRKKYTLHEAAVGISFDVKRGEFFGIIGQNGCGKSTLLKMLAKIYVPDKGRITLEGRLSPFLELGVGFNPELSARDNIYLNGVILGLTRKEIDDKFDEIIAFSELEEFIDQKLKNFSSGMQVRLAFSVAIQAHADILLIDEVLAVGDAGFQKKCFDVFRMLKREGKTIVFVSHGMSSIEEFCDRAMLVDEGKVIAIGEPKKVIYHYNTLGLNEDVASSEGEKARESDVRWGNKKIIINEFVLKDSLGKKSKAFNEGEKIAGQLRLKVNDREILKAPGFCILGVGLYDEKGNFIIGDSRRMKVGDLKTGKIIFSIELPRLQGGNYYFSASISNKKTNEVYDAHNKKYQIFVKNSIDAPMMLATNSFWYPKVKVLGMLRIRNEEEIIQDTLDHMSQFVDKIIVFDDASTDQTLDIVYNHSSVIDVIENKTWKNNRTEEETLNRQALLDLAQKYSPEWLFYSDADERFEGDIKGFLKSKEADRVDGIRISLFDAYMTDKDKSPYKTGEKLLNFRKYFGSERRDILMIWRNRSGVRYEGLDAREPVGLEGNIVTKFYCQHYGKSLSEKHWEETCDYYINNFPMYSEKWEKRRGKAVHSKSDFRTPLYTWREVKSMGIQIYPEKTEG